MGANYIRVDGRTLEAREGEFLGARIFGRTLGADELPYLFCGNGSCRDCNVLIDGLPDLPSCRLPACERLSVRTGEDDGTENALSRAIRSPSGADLECEVAVVGAGPAGLAAAAALREAGRDVVVLEARAASSEGVTSPAPAIVHEGRLCCFRDGVRHRLVARATVLATGASERLTTFPGSTLPGVLTCDLGERYLAHAFVPGARFLVVEGGERGARLASGFLERGAAEARQIPEDMVLSSVSGEKRVERARLVPRALERRSPRDEVEIEVDTVLVAGRRLPSLGLARALGCAVEYDRHLSGDRGVASSDGATTVAGVFLAGDALFPGTLDEARESGRRAGKAACTFHSGVL